MGNYNHALRMVSELGAIGTKTRYIFTVGLVLSSIFSLVFIIGLYKVCKNKRLNTIPVLIILTFPFSILGAGLFPYPLKLHEILGMPSILLFLSPLSSLIVWKSEKVPNIKQVSILAFLIMSLGLLTFTPNILSGYVGLKQRFFHIGWTIWFIYLAYRFIELGEMQIENNKHSS